MSSVTDQHSPAESTAAGAVEHPRGAALAAVPLGERLSVVLLTYNCAHRLQPVLDALVALDVPVIAVDNASVDDTADVLERQRGVEVVRLPSNTGAAGRNVGAQRVRTPYVAFCDDDGWYERAGLELACDLLDQHPDLDLINARILVGEEERLDPISAEMADSPLTDRQGLPGTVLLSFMGGAVVVRCSAYQEVQGYDPRFFMGGEEETLSFKLAKQGSAMRYVPEVVMHHHPSRANAASLRAFGMRNTLWNAWLHRPLRSALRWTAFTLADTPKNRDFAAGLWMAVRGMGWVLRERSPMDPELDRQLSQLDARRFAARRPLLTTRGWRPPS
jgi:N-acetylglucosaminyl-diphospho-decaprenol L-rhamnosyltransferase